MNIKFTFAVFILSSANAYAGKIETSICILNLTEKTQVIKVADIKNYNWESKNNRPDKNLHNHKIGPHQVLCKQEDVNSWSSDPSFTLIVDDVPQKMQYSAADKNTIDSWNVQPVFNDRMGINNPSVVRGWSRSPFGEGWEQGSYDCQITGNEGFKNCWGFFIGTPPL